MNGTTKAFSYPPCSGTSLCFVSDCTLHPLRVGYYASPACGSLHFLSDSADRPNARFARLDYTTGSDSYYHEYSAGEYLKISLEKPAYIRGIAVQGSPKNSRYYLKSMEVWYKITINNMNVGLGATTNEGYYKEAGETKVGTSFNQLPVSQFPSTEGNIVDMDLFFQMGLKVTSWPYRYKLRTS